MILKSVFSKGDGKKDKDGKYILKYVVTLEMSATDYKALKAGKLFRKVKGREIHANLQKHSTRKKHGYIKTEKVEEI